MMSTSRGNDFDIRCLLVVAYTAHILAQTGLLYISTQKLHGLSKPSIHLPRRFSAGILCQDARLNAAIYPMHWEFDDVWTTLLQFRRYFSRLGLHGLFRYAEKYCSSRSFGFSLLTYLTSYSFSSSGVMKDYYEMYHVTSQSRAMVDVFHQQPQLACSVE